jgi:hypothetical protein
MKYNKIICWVSKRHKKLMKRFFLNDTIFVNNIDDIDQKENDVIVISTSKIINMEITEKIKGLKAPYFLEKKGILTYNMMVAMEGSKHPSMIANCEINLNLFKDL